MEDRTDKIIVFKFSLWITGLVLKSLGYNLIASIISSILWFWVIHSFGYTILGSASKQIMQRLRISAASICVGALWLSKPAVHTQAEFFRNLRFWNTFEAASILFLCLCGFVILFLIWRFVFRRWLPFSRRKALRDFEFEVVAFYTFSIIVGLGARDLINWVNLFILLLLLFSEAIVPKHVGYSLRVVSRYLSRVVRKVSSEKAELRRAIQRASNQPKYAMFFTFFVVTSANFVFNFRLLNHIRGPMQLFTVFVGFTVAVSSLRALWKGWNGRKFFLISVLPLILLMVVWWLDPSSSPLLFGLALSSQIWQNAHLSGSFLKPSYISADIFSFRIISSIWITILVGICILAYVESKISHSTETVASYKRYRYFSCIATSGLLAILGVFVTAFLIFHPRFTPFIAISIPILIFLNGLFVLPLSAFFLQRNSLDKSDLEISSSEDIQREMPYLLSPHAKKTCSFKNTVTGILLGCAVWMIFGFIYLTIRGGTWLWAFVLLSEYRDFFIVMTSTSVCVGFVSTCFTLKDVPRRSITTGFKIGLILGTISLSLLCLSFTPKLLSILSMTNDPLYLQELITRLLCVTFPMFILAFCLGGMLAGAARFEKLLKL